MSIYIHSIEKYIANRKLFTSEEITISSGSKVGLIGNNGTGKTTLLEIIAGNQLVDQGVVQSEGQPVYVPQLLSTSSHYSGGEQVRKLIQTARRSGSTILLLDEPTNHLDKTSIKQLAKQIKSSTATFVIVSHDRNFLNQVCDSILAIEHNQLRHYLGTFSEYEQQKK